MGAPQKMYCCQWPGCVNFASREMRRGEHVQNLRLCVNHANQFKCMLPHEARNLHRTAAPAKVIKIATAERTRPTVGGRKGFAYD